MIKALLLSFLLFCTLEAHDVANGTVAVLEFDKLSTKALQKEGKNITLLAHPKDAQRYIALISIPYRQSKPIDLAHITTHGKEKLRLNIVQGAYQKEVLSVEPSKVSPHKEALQRIKNERDEANAIYNTFTPKRFWQKMFVTPLQSHITSDYGNARVFNNTLQSYHSGTDYRATIGTPIHASNDGIVVIARERYYAGGSVVIDHGEGIYSVYYHLSKIHFAVGEKVKQGEIVGLSGATGRITGPHLHFGFMVQGIPVDPLDFIAKINGLF